MLLGLHVHYDHMETAQSSHTSTSDTNNWEKENYQVLQMFLRTSSTLNIYIYIKRERERERIHQSIFMHDLEVPNSLPPPKNGEVFYLLNILNSKLVIKIQRQI